jgi:hypothetical protein
VDEILFSVWEVQREKVAEIPTSYLQWLAAGVADKSPPLKDALQYIGMRTLDGLRRNPKQRIEARNPR